MFDIGIKTEDYMSIVVTHKCNRSCPFCIDSYRGVDGYITLESIQKAIAFARSKNIKDILLVGGEPTLHPYIVDICKLVSDSGFRVVLTSNFDNLDKIYELDKYVDCFNMSFYNQKVMPDMDKINHADVTLSTLIYKGNLDSKEKLDEFIDKWGNKYKLKFSTLSVCNDFTRNYSKVDYLDYLESDWVVLFNEILGQIYRGYVIKRYDRVINERAKQSYKCHVDGSISRNWDEEDMLGKNRNCGHVIIKKDRECLHCKGIIPKGVKCLTVNTKYKGRKWLCKECEGFLDHINWLNSHIEGLNLDNEGSYFAFNDALATEQALWYKTEGKNKGKILKG